MEQQIVTVVQRQGERYIGLCDQFPEANGQGQTVPDCLHHLADALALAIEERGQTAPTHVPTPGMRQEPFVVTPIAMGLPDFECTSELLEHLDELEHAAGGESA